MDAYIYIENEFDIVQKTHVVTPGILFDYNINGDVIGVEILDFKRIQVDGEFID